jgi:hypothetical protein
MQTVYFIESCNRRWLKFPAVELLHGRGLGEFQGEQLAPIWGTEVARLVVDDCVGS